MTVRIFTEQDLRDLYMNFNTGDIDAILAAFSPDARYYQCESGAIGRGPTEIRPMLEGWRLSFVNAIIHNVTITHDTPAAPEADGAYDCWHVEYWSNGTFARPIPGLDIEPGGQKVDLATCDTIWVDASGKVLRLENSVHIPALQA